MTPVRTFVLLAGSAAILALGGCTYDYWQHTDRVGYHAGDAVKANLEGETINPQNSTLYKKSGLGKNGEVIPLPDSAPAANP